MYHVRYRLTKMNDMIYKVLIQLIYHDTIQNPSEILIYQLTEVETKSYPIMFNVN